MKLKSVRQTFSGPFLRPSIFLSTCLSVGGVCAGYALEPTDWAQVLLGRSGLEKLMRWGLREQMAFGCCVAAAWVLLETIYKKVYENIRVSKKYSKNMRNITSRIDRPVVMQRHVRVFGSQVRMV